MLKQQVGLSFAFRPALHTYPNGKIHTEEIYSVVDRN